MFRRQALLSMFAAPSAVLAAPSIQPPMEEPDELAISGDYFAQVEFEAWACDPDWKSKPYVGHMALDDWFTAIWCGDGAGKVLDLWAMRVEHAMNAYKLAVFDLGKWGPDAPYGREEAYAPMTTAIVRSSTWDVEPVRILFADLYAKYPERLLPRSERKHWTLRD